MVAAVRVVPNVSSFNPGMGLTVQRNIFPLTRFLGGDKSSESFEDSTVHPSAIMSVPFKSGASSQSREAPGREVCTEGSGRQARLRVPARPISAKRVRIRDGSVLHSLRARLHSGGRHGHEEHGCQEGLRRDGPDRQKAHCSAAS